jgi:hypothetical protein
MDCIPQAQIRHQELNDFLSAGKAVRTETLKVSTGEWAEPPPVASKCKANARKDRFPRLIAGENRERQCGIKRAIEHAQK